MTSSILRQTAPADGRARAVDPAPLLGAIALAIASVGVTGSSFMFLAPLLIGVALLGTLLWSGSLPEWVAGWAVGLGIGAFWLGSAIDSGQVSLSGAGLAVVGLALIIYRLRAHFPLSTTSFDAWADRTAEMTVVAVAFVLFVAVGAFAGGILLGIFLEGVHFLAEAVRSLRG